MSPDPDQQVSLEVSRGMLVVAAVILVVAWFGTRGDRPNDPDGFRSGHAFGSWSGPTIRPVLSDSARSDVLGVQIDPVEGFAFFLVERAPAGKDDVTISLINRSESLLGALKYFDPEKHQWPPDAGDFGQVVNVNLVGEPPSEAPTLDVGPMGDLRLQVQTVLYGDTRITWATPRKSSAWPLRVHIGKCELGQRVFLLTVYELQAKTPSADYEQGPIAAIASALRPL